MKKEHETLAIRSIERAAQIARSWSGFKGSVERDPNTDHLLFSFRISNGVVDAQILVDPLPYAQSEIEMNDKANAPHDEGYLGYAVFQMLERYSDLVGISALEAGLGTRCALGPIIGIDDIADREIDYGFLNASYKQSQEVFDLITDARSQANGRPTGRGNKPKLYPNSEERACQAVSNTVPRIVEMKDRYKVIQKEWQSASRNGKSGDETWREYWKQVAGPREYGHLPEDVRALFCHKLDEYRTPTFIACAIVADVFGLESTTLASKYKNWNRTHSISGIRI